MEDLKNGNVLKPEGKRKRECSESRETEISEDREDGEEDRQ